MVLVSEAEKEEKRRETICRNKTPWTWGSIYWDWNQALFLLQTVLSGAR